MKKITIFMVLIYTGLQGLNYQDSIMLRDHAAPNYYMAVHDGRLGTSSPDEMKNNKATCTFKIGPPTRIGTINQGDIVTLYNEASKKYVSIQSDTRLEMSDDTRSVAFKIYIEDKGPGHSPLVTLQSASSGKFVDKNWYAKADNKAAAGQFEMEKV